MKIILATDALHDPLIKLEDGQNCLFFDSVESLKQHPKYLEAKRNGEEIEIEEYPKRRGDTSLNAPHSSMNR